MIGSNQEVTTTNAQEPVKTSPLVIVEFGDGWISAAAWHHLKSCDKQIAPSQALKAVEFGDGWVSSSVWHHLQRHDGCDSAR
jgi:hypothetical protein